MLCLMPSFSRMLRCWRYDCRGSWGDEAESHGCIAVIGTFKYWYMGLEAALELSFHPTLGPNDTYHRPLWQLEFFLVLWQLLSGILWITIYSLDAGAL
jgi:hypothetical protein